MHLLQDLIKIQAQYRVTALLVFMKSSSFVRNLRVENSSLL